MYRPVLVTAPSIKPVTLAEVKAALDIGYSEKDTLLNGLIAAATAYLDGWTGILGRALCQQTWRQDFDGFSCWSRPPREWSRYGYSVRLRLPLFPVISITSVKYLDPSGVEQTVSSASYTLKNDSLGAYVEFVTTFTAPNVFIERASVNITYLAGYADNAGATTAPEAIKQAMLLLIRQWFDNPTPVIVGATVEKMPFAVEALLGLYRRQQF